MIAVEISDRAISNVSISKNTTSCAGTQYTRLLNPLFKPAVPARMTFGTTWNNLLENVEELPSDATLVTPLSRKAFRVTDVQEHRVLIDYRGENETIPLQRDQFETLHRRIQDSRGEFDLDRLPPNAEPYAAVFSVSSNFEIDEDEWVLAKAETQSPSSLVEHSADKNQDDEHEDETESIIETMMGNMGEPQLRIDCPIEGCQYSHRSASSVARHVSGSSTAKHIWENTDYAGWRDFVRKHGETPG
jgi:hypothetical protein